MKHWGHWALIGLVVVAVLAGFYNWFGTYKPAVVVATA